MSTQPKRTYSFCFIQKDHSRPYGKIEAMDDADFYRQLPGYLALHGGGSDPSDITWRRVETGNTPAPTSKAA